MAVYNTEKIPERLQNFCPYPKAQDRKSWESLSEEICKRTVEIADIAKKIQIGRINLSDWLVFTKTGNRVDFEEKYFARRRRLSALVMGECVSYKGSYLNEIADTIFAICEESAWQLPAHNSYVRDTKALPLPDVDRPLLDLFACETGAVLASTLYLLKEEIENVAPTLTKRVELEINNRIIKPYVSNWFWWMGGKGERTLNWTVWCTQNVLLTAFMANVENESQKNVLRKAVESLNCFLEDYGDDGCCDEGAQYYRHAGLCLFNASVVVNTVTGGAFEYVWDIPKIKNIANYILNAHVADKYYINFADCAAVAGRCGAREYLFGKACNLNELTAFAANDWKKEENKGLILENNLFYRLQSIFTEKEMSESTVKNQTKPKDVFYPSTGLFIARDNKYTLAVKAGHNADNHNHNDVGSFTIYIDGRPFLIDIGVENYTAKTFSDKRYEIWTMQSSWHNLPEFDSNMQMPGKEYCAKNVETSFSETESQIKMELSSAWGKTAKLNEYHRQVSIKKGQGIYISDCCAGNYKHAYLNLIFAKKPEITGNRVAVNDVGELFISNCNSVLCEEITVTDSRLNASWGNKIYRVRVRFFKKISLEIN